MQEAQHNGYPKHDLAAMKHIYIILGILFIALLVTWTQLPEISTDQRKITRLPWIIQTDEQGGSRVFGLAIGKATVKQAQETFNDEAEFAVFIDQDEQLSLEAFFNYTNIAGLQARMTLTLIADKQEIADLAEQSIEKKAQPSNSYKLKLPTDLHPTLFEYAFNSITYQPKIKIEKDILMARFGKPENIERTGEHTYQWRYPKKGLLITVSDEEKPVFIYVRPDQFSNYFPSNEEQQSNPVSAG